MARPEGEAQWSTVALSPRRISRSMSREEVDAALATSGLSVDGGVGHLDLGEAM